MQDCNLPDSDLLESVLKPLLEDFQYWFGRSRDLLTTEEISFMSKEQQADLLARVVYAQEEVNTAKMLLAATDGQAGVDMATLMPWHKLVHECWQVAMQHRQAS